MTGRREPMMRSAAIACGIAVLCAAAARADSQAIVIYSATPNINAHVLTIRGSGFGTAKPTVTLAGTPLAVLSSNNAAVDAVLPAVTPATYGLVVSRIEKGKAVGSARLDVFIGVIGGKGPTGPKGATGSAGPAGVQGVQGPHGATGTAGSAGGVGPQGLPGAQGPTGARGPGLHIGNITGRVLGCDDMPAAAAHAAITGTSFDVTTGVDGRFMLRDVPSAGHDVTVQLGSQTAMKTAVVVADQMTNDVGDVKVCAGP